MVSRATDVRDPRSSLMPHSRPISLRPQPHREEPNGVAIPEFVSSGPGPGRVRFPNRHETLPDGEEHPPVQTYFSYRFSRIISTVPHICVIVLCIEVPSLRPEPVERMYVGPLMSSERATARSRAMSTTTLSQMFDALPRNHSTDCSALGRFASDASRGVGGELDHSGVLV